MKCKEIRNFVLGKVFTLRSFWRGLFSPLSFGGPSIAKINKLFSPLPDEDAPSSLRNHQTVFSILAAEK